jgi:hypothetical protein
LASQQCAAKARAAKSAFPRRKALKLWKTAQPWFIKGFGIKSAI